MKRSCVPAHMSTLSPFNERKSDLEYNQTLRKRHTTKITHRLFQGISMSTSKSVLLSVFHIPFIPAESFAPRFLARFFNFQTPRNLITGFSKAAAILAGHRASRAHNHARQATVTPTRRSSRLVPAASIRVAASRARGVSRSQQSRPAVPTHKGHRPLRGVSRLNVSPGERGPAPFASIRGAHVPRLAARSGFST